MFGWLFRKRSTPSYEPARRIGTGHSYMCECDACIEAFMRSQYEDRGIARPTGEELMRNQREYDRLIGVLGGAPSDRTSGGAFEMHQRVMRIMAGKEAEPA